MLHSERFCEQTPAHVYHALLGKGRYLGSIRTLQRIPKAAGESRERRPIRPPQRPAVPRLQAMQPNQVWTWDIPKLAQQVRGKWLYLFVLIDLYSGYVVGWMETPRSGHEAPKRAVSPWGNGLSEGGRSTRITQSGIPAPVTEALALSEHHCLSQRAAVRSLLHSFFSCANMR